MARDAAEDMELLPQAACPHDEAVGLLTMHPQSTARSYYPEALLAGTGLQHIGSRAVLIEPEKWTRVHPIEAVSTTQIYVAAPRSTFMAWAEDLPTWKPDARGAKDLVRIEAFCAATARDRLREIRNCAEEPVLEAVLHITPNDDYVLAAFEEYCHDLEAHPELEHRVHAGGLCFMPVRAHREALEQLSQFAFLRILRDLPGMRPLPLTLMRAVPIDLTPAVTLPDADAIKPEVRAAVFDGGITNIEPLKRWVTLHEAGTKAALAECKAHGTWVTSGLLFGPISETDALATPFGTVDHFRVFDVETDQSDYELYDVLKRIQDTLQTWSYEFVNISVGPAAPIDDDHVHVWTAVLDELFANGDVLAAVAVGNDGELDAASGNNRVQAPSDGVNVLGVGAADSQGSVWRRAPYSSVGPGRLPGVVKPDVLAFGGSWGEPFLVLEPSTCATAMPQAGTSFASPAALRLAMGVRACFGDVLSPLTLKALLLHCAEPPDDSERFSCGWGRVPQSIDEMVICPDGTARIVYQGTLDPGRVLRAPIPLPADILPGLIKVRATFCYATVVDPQDPCNYTRSGLDIVFRPDENKMSEGGQVAASERFFKRHDYSTEDERRQFEQKWETSMHAERQLQAGRLHRPVFDVHYIARSGGGPAQDASPIPYALVVTISSRKVRDLYNRILQAYPTHLEALVPQIEIPITVRGAE